MKKSATAVWKGSLSQGQGTITTESQAVMDAPYSFNTRFENQKGTNPEELIAAAHAGCFSMALSHQLAAAQLTPDSIHAMSTVHLEKTAEGFHIPLVHLDVSAHVPNATQAQFLEAAETAKKNCPVSRLLNAKITMEARLE